MRLATPNVDARVGSALSRVRSSVRRVGAPADGGPATLPVAGRKETRPLERPRGRGRPIGLRVVLGCSLLAALACGGGPKCGEGTEEKFGECVAEGGDSGGDSGGGGDAGGDSGGDSGGDATPVIVSFATNTRRATEGDTLVFSAAVTDADGDLVGGQLETPAGAVCGTFGSTSDEGGYEVSLTWAQLDTAEDLTFEGDTARSFTARFFDQGGHEVEDTVEVSLYCDTGGACGGHCAALDSDVNHCGACDNVCTGAAVANDSVRATCEAGACVVASECVDDVQQSCDTVCGAEGMDCWEGGDYPGVVIDVYGGGGDGTPSCDEYRTTTTTSRCSQLLASAPQAQADDWAGCFRFREP